MATAALVPLEQLGKTLQKAIKQASRVRVAMALVSPQGVEGISPWLEDALKRGAEVEFLFGIDLPSHPEAIAGLVGLAGKFPDAFTLRYFASPESRYFHPKLWVLESTSASQAIVGSSNVTGGGFEHNYEANVLVDGEAAEELGNYFDELFLGAYARPVDATWLTAYQRIWESREALRKKDADLRKQMRPRPRPGKRLPKRIKGNYFVFTGRIPKQPRERVLYPRVKRAGGLVGLKASAVPHAAALVQGELMGGEDTLKLRTAREVGAVIITQEEFLTLLAKEERD
jgi:HKD family nuclease